MKKSYSRQLKRFHFPFLLGALSISPFLPTTFAGETIYQLKDSNGTTVLTNKKSRYNSLKVEKKTYYPDSNIHTYRNWGTSEASVLPSQSRNKNAYDHYIRQAAQTHGVSEGLIKAVMHTESGFNIHARSPVGAQGLMQLMPATAKRFNVSNAYDPQQNIFAGAKYLAWLLKRFNGDTRLALAGYNAGEGNVAKYGGIPPFRETQDYVRRVTSRFNNLYANGLGAVQASSQSSSYSASSNSSSSNSSSNTRQTPQGTLIASGQSTTTNAGQSISQSNPPPKYSNRQIIVAADGSFTDAPAGSYSTTNASATAKIYFSN